jgi:hypothetical protein
VSLQEQLRRSLRLLAAPAAHQLDLFPSLTSTPDHMALEFEHWHDIVIETQPETLSSAQQSALSGLEDQLDAMADGDEETWTECALRESPAWERVRVLARAALAAFGWQEHDPATDSEP